MMKHVHFLKNYVLSALPKLAQKLKQQKVVLASLSPAGLLITTFRFRALFVEKEGLIKAYRKLSKAST